MRRRMRVRITQSRRLSALRQLTVCNDAVAGNFRSLFLHLHRTLWCHGAAVCFHVSNLPKSLQLPLPQQYLAMRCLILISCALVCSCVCWQYLWYLLSATFWHSKRLGYMGSVVCVSQRQNTKQILKFICICSVGCLRGVIQNAGWHCTLHCAVRAETSAQLAWLSLMAWWYDIPLKR